MIKASIVGNKIMLDSDDPSVRMLLEYIEEEPKFVPKGFKGKTWYLKKQKKHIYSGRPKQINPGVYRYELGLGFAAYVLNVFKAYLNVEDYNRVSAAVLADNYRDIPFQGLRDYQNDDVLHLLKYRLGLFSCYTGYGKSQIIATLANYAYTGLGKAVLLMAPSIKAKDELVKRCKSVFGLNIPSDDGRINCVISSGVMNSKKYKDPVLLMAEKAKFAQYEWVIADEVEYVVSPGGKFLLDMCTGVTNLYGFSGTSDKVGGQMISFAQGLSKCVTDNLDLVKYFGPSLVYRLPLHLNIDCVSVRTEALNNLQFDEEDFNENSNVYQNVMNKIWSSPEVCKTIVKIAKNFPMLFIPINNLAEVINNWIENWFIGEFRVLLISGEGYIYYDLAGNRSVLNLETACDYIRNGLVDIIPSTSSGYRALDFPGLENILLIQGAIAGVVLQCIGRVARGTHLNIIDLIPKYSERIPIYTKGSKERKKMIREYYKYCKIEEYIINEENLNKQHGSN